MNKFYLLLLAVFVSVNFVNAQNLEGSPQLRGVKKIYVASLGDDDRAKIVKEKLEIRLAEKGFFEVVEKESDADAVLSGTVTLEKDLTSTDGSSTVITNTDKNKKTTTSVYSTSPGSRSNSTFIAVFHLKDAKTGDNLWTYDFDHKKLFGFFQQTNRSSADAYNELAKRTVKKLLEASGKIK